MFRPLIKVRQGLAVMTRKEQLNFHADRATAELDKALDAPSLDAAKAHFDRSALHFDKLRDLSQGPQPSRS